MKLLTEYKLCVVHELQYKKVEYVLLYENMSIRLFAFLSVCLSIFLDWHHLDALLLSSTKEAHLTGTTIHYSKAIYTKCR